MSTPSPALGNRTPEQLKVAELREELKKRGIQIKGLKKDLVDRLEEVLKQEELVQQKALETVEEDAVATAVDADQPDPVTPVTKRRSKGHDHHAKEEAKDNVVPEPVLASEGTEITVSVPVPPVAEKSLPQEGDTVPRGTEETTVAAGVDNVVLSAPAGEDVPVVESATTSTSVPALEDLVADLEHNFNNVVEEEPAVQQAGVEETGTMEGQVPSEMFTDIVPTVEKAVDGDMAVTEEVVSTTCEKTVTTTVEEQEVSVVPEDQNIATAEEEQIVTTSTRIETMEESANEVATMKEITTTVETVEESATKVATMEETTTTVETMEESANKVATMEETTTTVVTVETTTTVTDGEGVMLGTEAVNVLEDKRDDTMEEVPKEDATKVADEATVAKSPKDEMPMDVDAGTEKGSNVEGPKEETPMDVDADTQKGSKRKDAGWSFFLTQLFPFSTSSTVSFLSAHCLLSIA